MLLKINKKLNGKEKLHFEKYFRNFLIYFRNFHPTLSKKQ